MKIEVKNIEGSGKYKAYKKGYNSWKDYWIDKSGKTWPSSCAVARCNKKPVDGAHVKKTSSKDNHWYIVPMCHEHNMEDANHDVSDEQMIPVVDPKDWK